MHFISRSISEKRRIETSQCGSLVTLLLLLLLALPVLLLLSLLLQPRTCHP